MNQLPLKFKLFCMGEHVGFEEHFFNTDNIQIEIFHQNLKGETGRILYGFYIPHDEKRQSTGYYSHGKEIFIGDKLVDPLGNPSSFYIISFIDGELKGINNLSKRCFITADYFFEMELAK